jgi:hypothetical protein
MVMDQYPNPRKVKIMLPTSMTKMENVWNTFQEPRCSAYLPNSYMLLLSALDQGWKVIKVEMEPSWDQNGFIYLVSLKRQSHPHTQQLILPYNSLVAYLLQKYGNPVAANLIATHQQA